MQARFGNEKLCSVWLNFRCEVNPMMCDVPTYPNPNAELILIAVGTKVVVYGFGKL